MMDWKETRNDYNNEREQNEKLKPIADEQNKEISQLNEALNNIRKQKEEALLKKQKCQQQIDGLKYATQEYEKKGRDRIEDLNRQLERAEAEQNRHIQIDQNVNQEPQAARLEIQSKQSDENGKWKVEIEFNQNYTQLEIEEQLQANKKSVELKGYAILDFTVFYFNQIIELQKQVQQRESINLDGLVLTIIYK